MYISPYSKPTARFVNWSSSKWQRPLREEKRDCLGEGAPTGQIDGQGKQGKGKASIIMSRDRAISCRDPVAVTAWFAYVLLNCVSVCCCVQCYWPRVQLPPVYAFHAWTVYVYGQIERSKSGLATGAREGSLL